jgi:hypothetical protein
VQEEDGARFDWDGAAKRRRAGIRLGWEERAVTPKTADAIATTATDLTMEDLPDEAVMVEPLDPGRVHRRQH